MLPSHPKSCPGSEVFKESTFQPSQWLPNSFSFVLGVTWVVTTLSSHTCQARDEQKFDSKRFSKASSQLLQIECIKAKEFFWISSETLNRTFKCSTFYSFFFFLWNYSITNVTFLSWYVSTW